MKNLKTLIHFTMIINPLHIYINCTSYGKITVLSAPKKPTEIREHIFHIYKKFKGLPQLKIIGFLCFSLQLVLCDITYHEASARVH